MNKLTKTLLGGAALSVLAAVPAMAQQKHPAFSFTALHAGRVVNKTRMANLKAMNAHSTPTFTIYTSVPASDLHKRVPLANTFYKWNSYSTICSSPKQKIKVPKKSMYGKVSAATQTYSFGCDSGPSTFYGDAYKLTDSSGEGRTDKFFSNLIGKFRNKNGTYRGVLTLYVEVAIGTE